MPTDRIRRMVAPVARPLIRRRRAFMQRDWATGPPDFVGVGAQRSGTTWWYGLLRDHPRIHAGEKELHFFDGYFRREFSDADAEAYHRRLRRPAGHLVGEWTPRYMHDFWVPALLRRAAPDARILVLLRDPLERYRSGLSHEVDRFMRSVPRRRREYAAAMSANDALDRSLYGSQLRRLLDQFDRERVLVLQYESCVGDPARELRRTYEFLGADPADHVPAFLTKRAGRAHPPVDVTDPVTEAALRVILRDVADLKALVPEIDLGLWASCRGIATGAGAGA